MKPLLYRPKTLNALKEEYEKLNNQTAEATHFIRSIEEGNLQVDISEELEAHDLGSSLISMKKTLLRIADEEQERNWINEGLGKFSDILRNKDSLNFTEITDNILRNLVRYIGAVHGAAYILVEEDKNQHLELVSCYAFERKKHRSHKIQLGQGLAGQCVLEKKPIYLTDIPPDYTQIRSGLGESIPEAIFICPLEINEAIFGVLELASLEEISETKRDFVLKLAENIAASVKSIKEAERTIKLLEASKDQAAQLMAQEEEMRQNNEELLATQEQIERRSNEVKQTYARMEGIMNGINATMATIEFNVQGEVQDANENFLQTMKCSLPEIKGRHHRMFVPKEISEQQEYLQFWKDLAVGKPQAGIFRRTAFDGATIWLNAIYNPIFNADGQVERIMKFATDITSQQEALAETKGLVDGINSTMATIEFRPDGTILTANDNFLQTIQYSLSEIRGKHHRMFVPQDIEESEEYERFWNELGDGQSKTGTFRRVGKDGSTIWLQAMYNPIRNAAGEVVKVIKFASDITAQQESQAETQGLIEGINATMAKIEFTADGTILSANENFLQAMKYSLDDIRGQHHRMFVEEGEAETEEYQQFWQNLGTGKAVTGNFERIAADGSHVHLSAIYNPMRNASGEVVKVIKLATIVAAS